MRIFLTGLNGFIGKSLFSNLSKNHEIISLVRRKNNRNSKENILEIEGNLKEPKKWLKSVKNFSPECCIHLAWDGLPDYSLGKCNDNIYQNLNLIDILIDISVKRVVIAGSCWEYGNTIGSVPEEKNPKDPSLFALSKLSILSFYENLCKEKKIDYRWARIFFTYGPNQRDSSLIPTLWRNIRYSEKNIINSPNIFQDYIYVDDVANCLLEMISEKIPSGIYNLGSGKLHSVAEIAKIIYSYYDLKSPFKKYEGINKEGIYSNTNKTESLLYFKPKFSLKDGVIKTLQSLDKINGFN